MTPTPYRVLIPWPRITRGKNAGKLVPAVTGNNSVGDWKIRSSRIKRLRGHAGTIAMHQRVEQEVPKCGDERRRISVVVYRGKGQRILDREQVVAMLKPFVDGLVDAGWLRDDSPKWLDYAMPEQVKDNREGPSVLFLIQPAGAIVERPGRTVGVLGANDSVDPATSLGL